MWKGVVDEDVIRGRQARSASVQTEVPGRVFGSIVWRPATRTNPWKSRSGL